MKIYVNRHMEETNERQHYTLEMDQGVFMIYLENLIEIMMMNGHIKNLTINQVPKSKDEISLFTEEE